MTTDEKASHSVRRPLRLWPGVVLVVLQWLLRFVVPVFIPDAMAVGAIAALLGGVAVAVWWAFFSRAPHVERWGAIVLMVAALFGTRTILHESIATGGMGFLFFMYALPVLSLAFVAWAVVSRRLADGPRRLAMVATILLTCGVWALFRTGGFTGEGDSDFAWRWTMTPEERLLAKEVEDPPLQQSAPVLASPVEEVQVVARATGELEAAPTPAAAEEAPAAAVEEEASKAPAAPVTEAAQPAVDWPGFRGLERDGSARGMRLATDWSATPPVELWRRPIGPGWSSFAVHGDLLYTQEQRGDDEVVSCYHATTGEPVWRHTDPTRFWESNAGAGPRGTPTLSNGRVYAFGATGILNVLEEADGALVWSRNAAADTGAKLPGWGFSSSPLVVEDVVIVAASGSLVAYEVATGEPRWFGPAGGASYSSPQLLTIDGVAQVVLLKASGAIGLAPGDGTLLWEHAWEGYPIVQPALTADGDVLLAVNAGSGIRRLGVARAGGLSANAELQGTGGWSVEERWTSLGLKPYFNDFVVHEGHAFGFDGSILSAIELGYGERQWKGGRYGHGQLVLLPEQDLLLVLSEKGELVLVAAVPDKFTELARFPAIEGKTWNHPVLVGNRLLVRNGQEMAAFRLPLADG